MLFYTFLFYRVILNIYKTPLFIAVENKSLEIAKILLSNGETDPNFINILNESNFNKI